jgi:hypothetical protein
MPGDELTSRDTAVLGASDITAMSSLARALAHRVCASWCIDTRTMAAASASEPQSSSRRRAPKGQRTRGTDDPQSVSLGALIPCAGVPPTLKLAAAASDTRRPHFPRLRRHKMGQLSRLMVRGHDELGTDFGVDHRRQQGTWF